MKVIGHRVLVRPDEQPATQGAILLPEDRDFVATSGEVLQVGAGGSAWRFDERQRTISAVSHAIETELQMRSGTAFEPGLKRATELAIGLLGTASPTCDVEVGDRVAFDADSGVAIRIDGEPFLILEHDSVVVIVSEREAVA